MGGLLGAWAVGQAVVIWRQVSVSHKPPVPGSLLGVSALFLGLALVADAAPAARRLVTATAWGLDIAGILHLWPQGLSAEFSRAQETSAQAESQGTTASTGTEAV